MNKRKELAIGGPDVHISSANITAGGFNLFSVFATSKAAARSGGSKVTRFQRGHFQTGTKLPFETLLVNVFNFKATRSKCLAIAAAH